MFNKYIKQNFIQQTLKFPLKTIFISLGLTAIIGLGLLWFEIDDDFVKLLPQDIPSKIIWDDIQQDFGASEIMLIAFGNKNKSIYRKEVFDAVWDLTDSLKIQKDLVEEVISIKTLNRLESKDGFMEVGDLFVNSEGILTKNIDNKDIENIKNYLGDNPNIKSRIISKYDNYVSIVIRPVLNTNMTETVERIKPIVTSVLNEEFEVHYAGQVYITGEVPDLIKKDTSTLVVLAILLMIIVLLINFRNISAVLMILIIIILSMISMAGFMGWMHKLTGLFIFKFTMMNTSMPVVLLTIANSDGVHILTRFFRETRKQQNVKDGVKTTLEALFLPIFLTSFTTAIAFLAFIFSPVEQMTGYGISIAFAIMWAWILSTTLLPSMILLKKWNVDASYIKKESFIEKIVRIIGKNISKAPKKVLYIGISIVLVSIYGFQYLDIEVNTSKFFKQGHPIRESNEFVDYQLTGSMNFLINTIGNHKDPNVLNDINNLQVYLEKQDRINTTISIADIVKQMNKTFQGNNDAYKIPNEGKWDVYCKSDYDISEFKFDVNGANDKLIIKTVSNDMEHEYLEITHKPANHISGRITNSNHPIYAWETTLISFTSDKKPESLNNINITDHNGNLQDFVFVDSNKEKPLNSLWIKSVDQMKVDNLFTLYEQGGGKSDDFDAVVQQDSLGTYNNGLITGMMQSISTKETIKLVNDLESYIDNNISSNLETKISGLAVFFRDFVNLLIQSSIISILISIFVIFIISWFFFKGLKWGLLAIVPLTCAVILNFGLMGLFGIKLSHITAILTAIIIGVGVDFAIHYISEFKRNLKDNIPLETITKDNVDDVGYPILLDVLSNMGFVTLLFSTLIPLNYMGGLMVFAMLSTSMGTLTLLASLIEINKEYLRKNKQ